MKRQIRSLYEFTKEAGRLVLIAVLLCAIAVSLALALYTDPEQPL